MGKKKSMVLMVIISVILAALTLITVLPSFAFPWNDGLNGWRSVVAEFVDFGSDYKGGHYAYYYPEGIIPESQYKALSEDEQEDYAKLGDGGLYVDKNADVADGDGVSADFNAEFAKFRDAVSERYRQKGYSDYVVTVVDNYAIRVEVPVSDANYAETLALFAETRKLTMKLNGEVVDELSDEDANIRDYIQEFSLRSQFAYRYIHVRLTKAGADLINGLEEDSSIVSQSSDTTQDGKTGLWLYFDDEPALPIYKENVASDYVLKCAYNEADYESALQTRVVLFNSLLNDGDYSFTISDVSSVTLTVAPEYPYAAKTYSATLLPICLALCSTSQSDEDVYSNSSSMPAYGTLIRTRASDKNITASKTSEQTRLIKRPMPPAGLKTEIKAQNTETPHTEIISSFTTPPPF
jgi:hypothetical protein